MNVHSPSASEDLAARPAAPSGGRRVARAQEIRGRLLDAAEALIAERQSAAITARDVARTAGVSDGVLYNHFADKHELLLAALIRRFERLVDVFQAELGDARTSAPPPDLEAGVVRLVGSAFRLHAGALPMLANVLSEPALFSRFMAAIHRPPLGPHVFMDPIEAHLVAEQRAERIGDVDPRAATHLLVGSILLAALQELVAPRPPEAVERHLRELVQALVTGLAPRAATT